MIFEYALIIIGLSVFEIVSSIDNAVVNADVLSTMKNEKAKKFFLTFGIFFAVLGVRGVLPFLIVWLANPSLGLVGSFTAMLSSDPSVKHAIEASAPVLMMGGGMFLLLLCLQWLFMEEKEHFGLPFEESFQNFGMIWFYAISSLLLPGVIIAIKQLHAHDSINLILAATIGYCVFFITDGFKQNAEAMEKKMVNDQAGLSDWSKVLFLEVIDTTFSIDGVVGAFAFTMMVPLILIGNGIGAVVVRQLTIGNIDRIKRYVYLKNGAMYSIGFLGTVMILEAFHIHVPNWLSPIVTVSMIVYFFLKSQKYNKTQANKN